MSVRVAAVAAAAALAAAIAPSAPSASAAAAPLDVRTSITPQSIYVADVVTARVDVYFDPRRVDPGSVAVTPRFGLWQQLDAPRLTSATSPTADRRTWSFTLACLSEDCVPPPKLVRSFDLPRLAVAARAEDGARIAVRRAWPAIQIAGRFAPPSLHAHVSLRVQTTVPAPVFGVDPASLEWALVAVGGVLVALGLAVATLEAVRWRASRRRVVDTRSPLARALELVRQSQDREPEERRRAVGALSRVLHRDPGALASAASEVAWSDAEPTRDRLEEIARRVEAELEGTT